MNINLPNEAVITESNNGGFKLTTHRVRLAYGDSFTSIMLENVSMARVEHISKPILLILGVVGILLAIASLDSRNGEMIAMLIGMVGIGFIVAYIVGRKQSFVIEAKGGGTLTFSMSGIKRERAMEFIDQMEQAIDARNRSLTGRL
ncbi:MAG: hypothetical protein R2815_08225 [Flavobacteriales bacterium]